MDQARSASPAVQAQIDRLVALSPGADVLGLSRISALLDRLGNPERRLPPVLHVAGTNGKGSTCAYLRAAIEAAGLSAHAYTSPHLVRFNERIRIAGRLIDDDTLAPLLTRVLDHADGIGASFFEVTTAAAFLIFAETPADACIVEVGLGGRLDATNVVVDPAVCGIAQLGIDHQAFLGHDPAGIAREKAGIAKRGRPLVTLGYPSGIDDAVAAVAAAAGAPVFGAGRHWRFDADPHHRRLLYADARGSIVTPLPVLAGGHQHANLALAIAMLRHQDRIAIPSDALRAAPVAARWPARMQRLAPGPLAALLPDGAELWLDGGHNQAAADAIAAALAEIARGRPVALVLGMLANKDAPGLLAPFAPLVHRIRTVAVPDHDHHAPAHLARVAHALGIADAAPADDVPQALTAIAVAGDAPVVLILGSLYLAGEVLAANGERPD